MDDSIAPQSFAPEIPRDSIERAEHQTTDGERRKSAQKAKRLAIEHFEYGRDVVVIDAIREARSPFSPEVVVGEFAALLKSYRVYDVQGDCYGGEWPVEQFSKYGIRYAAAAKSKSDLYIDLLALLNRRRLNLLDHAKLISQLCGLERRSTRGGKDSTDHAPGSHDDLANALAGVAAATINNGYDTSYRWVNGDDADDPDGARAWRATRLAAYLYSGGTVRL